MSPVLAAALAVATLALAGCSGAGLEPLGGVGTDEGFGRCDAYEGRGQAQRAWRDAGRPASADRDGDGRVCESLASRGSGGSGAGSSSARSSSSEGVAQTTGCERPSRPVVVTYSRREYPHITDHIEDAQRAGYPRVMRIKREGADDRRDELLEGIDTREGMDRDEYPPSVGRTASTASAASVRLLPSSENRSAGAVLGETLSSYCDGVHFRLRLTP